MNEELTDDALLRQIEAAEATIFIAERNKKRATADLLDRREKEIEALLRDKAEPFGDVTITVGNHQVKVNVPKKVEWDNKLLADKYREIASSGENPDLYIQASYKISETAYKNYPDDVRTFFEDARTVSKGNPSLKIVKEKE